MEQLIYKLNNKNYLLVEVPIFESKRNKSKVLVEEKMKKHSCIFQGIKKFGTVGLFRKAFLIIKILVPEENIIAFNEED